MHIQLLNLKNPDNRYQTIVIDEDSLTAAIRIVDKHRGRRFDQVLISGFIVARDRDLQDTEQVVRRASSFLITDNPITPLNPAFCSVAASGNDYRRTYGVSYFASFSKPSEGDDVMNYIIKRSMELLP